MKGDRVMLQGLLAEKRLKLKELVTKANALVANIHIQASPYLPVANLVVDQITSQAKDLEQCVYKIRALSSEIRALEEELGIESNG